MLLVKHIPSIGNSKPLHRIGVLKFVGADENKAAKTSQRSGSQSTQSFGRWTVDGWRESLAKRKRVKNLHDGGRVFTIEIGLLRLTLRVAT